MAKVKLKLGDNEIEVDSRDFYVDNQTINQVIDNLSNHLPENRAQVVYEPSMPNGLESLEDAEIYEPEFNKPQHIVPSEIKSKLRILETSGFFASPRTVTETVEQLREYGWAASLLDVSKMLAKMASTKEIMKNSTDNKAHYFVRPLLAE